MCRSGNPAGAPTTIEVATVGLAASRRDGRVRAAITALLDHAQQQNCAAVVIENLDFADARATGRETLGRGQRGKRLRRTVAGIPTARLRTRLTAMAARRGISVIGVDAAFTSKWGAQHWRNPLQQHGHTTDQARPPPEHHTTARWFRPTDTPTPRRAGPPENTRRPRPTPFGPQTEQDSLLLSNQERLWQPHTSSAVRDLILGDR